MHQLHSAVRNVSLISMTIALALAGACSNSDDPQGSTNAGGGDASAGESSGAHSPNQGGSNGGEAPSGVAGSATAGTATHLPGTGGVGSAGEHSTGGTSTDVSGAGAGAEPGAAGAGGAAGASGAAGAGGAGDPFEGCDYVERDDLGNDVDANDDPSPEDTNLLLDGPITICGRLDPGHFAGDAADIDRFTFHQTPDLQELIFRLRTEGPVGSGDVGMQFQGTWSDLVDGKAVISQQAIGQDLRISVAALDEAIDEPIVYRLRIDFDAQDVRCPKVTSAASYVEAHDGASNDGNDVFINDDDAFAFTPASSDVPESTNLSIASSAAYRLSGNSADVPLSGNYFDADTYAIHTGPTTDQLTIRLDWPDSLVDFDYLLAREGSEQLQAGGTDEDFEREFHTFSVAPDTTYWLWVAPYLDAEGLPIDYDVSICGESFEP